MKKSEYRVEGYVYCHECNRGGNGDDKDKCSCGWQIKKETSLGCFLGEPMGEAKK